MKCHFAAAAAGLVLMATATPLIAQTPPPPGSVFLNELVIDSRGSNLTELEFIELFTPQPNTPLGGLAVISVLGVEVPQSNLKPGHILHSFVLPPSARSDERGFYLLANQRAEQGYGVVADFKLAEADRLTNEAQTFAIVRASEAPKRGDSITTSTRFPSGIYDTVAINDAKPNNVFFFNAPVVGPDGLHLAAGAARLRDGVHTGDKSDWVLADIELPPTCYNTPKAPNKAGAHVVVVDGRTPVPSGAGAATPVTPAQTQAPPADKSQVFWRNYDPYAVEAAIEAEGSALVYARSSTFSGCVDFERAYLLIPSAQPLLAGRPTFFLNVNLPGNGRFASDMGIYKVPTLAFRRKGGAWEYLVINSDVSPQDIYQFLRKR